jgi:outer membrane lipoprotein SlyB
MKARITALGLALALTGAPLIASAQTYYKAAGETISGTLQQDINTKTAQDGQRFTVRTDGGSTIYGHLTQVDRANIGRKAHVKLNFDWIRFPNGATSPLHASVESVQQKTQVNYGQAAGQVLGGMIVGNIIGKKIGTNLGGLVGLAGGALLAKNTSTNIDIPAGSQMTVRLNSAISSAHPQAR